MKTTFNQGDYYKKVNISRLKTRHGNVKHNLKGVSKVADKK